MIISIVNLDIKLKKFDFLKNDSFKSEMYNYLGIEGAPSHETKKKTG